jgi:hypothetical protein
MQHFLDLSSHFFFSLAPFHCSWVGRLSFGPVTMSPLAATTHTGPHTYKCLQSLLFVTVISFSLILITPLSLSQNYTLADTNEKAHEPFHNHLFIYFLLASIEEKKQFCLLSLQKCLLNNSSPSDVHPHTHYFIQNQNSSVS